MNAKFIAKALLLEATLMGGVALAQETAVPTQQAMPPTMTAIQPVNPVASKPGGPIIQSITAQVPATGALGLGAETIIPQFHFIAPNGNAVLLHREIVDSSSANVRFNPSAPINIPADAQKQGAVFSGGWGCGTAQYHTTVRAYILDSDGNKSNEVQYTVYCNGG